jgi:hypothetical protein
MATYIGATPLTRAVQKRKDFKATASQTTFSFSYQPGYLDVYVNGVKQREGAVPEDYTASDGVNVVFHTGLALNAEVDLIGLSNFEPNTITSIDEVDATAALQTTFNIPSYNPGYITVYLSGVRLDQSDYAATTGNTVVLVSGAGIAIGDTLAVHSFEAFNVADVYTQAASDAKYMLATATTLPTQADPGTVNKYLQSDGTDASWSTISTIFPFFKANSTSDTIAITNGTFPFFKADGTSDTIPVT